MIRVWRVYDDTGEAEGSVFLVDRLWPHLRPLLRR